MAKYIIEFEDEPSMREDGVNYYTCKSARWYNLGDTIINRLEPYTEPDREAIAGEVWEFAKKIGSFNGLSKHELDECFGHTTIQGVMTTYDTYQEAKAKYEAWKKQKDEIRVGDEVELYEGAKGLVYIVGEEMLEGAYLNCNGLVSFCWKKKDCRKTGKHFDDIEELLKKMRGEE